jgi:hypothetical protein
VKRSGACRLSAEKIAACGTLLREQLQNGDPAFRKAYLNLLIDQVEVDDAEIRIRGPKSALAAVASGKLSKPSDGVPSFVREWRPRRETHPKSENLIFPTDYSIEDLAVWHSQAVQIS